MNEPPAGDSEATLEPEATRESLLTQLRQATDDVVAATSTRDQLRRLRADGFDDDEHDPDGVPLSSEIVRLASIISAATQRVNEINAALEDLKYGRYGICIVCGRVIPPARLAIRPTATRCVNCVR